MGPEEELYIRLANEYRIRLKRPKLHTDRQEMVKQQTIKKNMNRSLPPFYSQLLNMGKKEWKRWVCVSITHKSTLKDFWVLKEKLLDVIHSECDILPQKD